MTDVVKILISNVMISSFEYFADELGIRVYRHLPKSKNDRIYIRQLEVTISRDDFNLMLLAGAKVVTPKTTCKGISHIFLKRKSLPNGIEYAYHCVDPTITMLAFQP